MIPKQEKKITETKRRQHMGEANLFQGGAV